MKRFTALAVAFLFGLALAAFAQSVKDAVTADPDVHHVVLENDHVRVFEARAAHGTRSPMHSHPNFLLVSVGSTRMKLTLPDGKTAIIDLKPGQVMWMENAQHSWQVLSGELHAVAVEVKSAAKPAAGK